MFTSLMSFTITATRRTAVEQGGFARAEEAGQHGDGQLLRCGGWHGHRCP